MRSRNPSVSDQYWHIGGVSGLLFRATIRSLQFVFAIIVAALYGVDLHHSTKTHKRANSAWVFAEVVACLSVITCAVHCLVTVKRVAWCAWDWVLFFLWVSQFGVFEAIYIGGNSSTDEDDTQSVRRMKIAVWFDFLNMLLWFMTAMGGIVWCCATRRVTRRTDKIEMGEDAAEEPVNGQLNIPVEEDGREFKLSDKDSDEATLMGDDDDSMKEKIKLGEDKLKSDYDGWVKEKSRLEGKNDESLNL